MEMADLVGLFCSVRRVDTEDPIGFVLSANVMRRHLSAAQRREVIAKVLELAPERSDRSIAADFKSARRQSERSESRLRPSRG